MYGSDELCSRASRCSWCHQLKDICLCRLRESRYNFFEASTTARTVIRQRPIREIIARSGVVLCFGFYSQRWCCFAYIGLKNLTMHINWYMSALLLVHVVRQLFGVHPTQSSLRNRYYIQLDHCFCTMCFLEVSPYLLSIILDPRETSRFVFYQLGFVESREIPFADKT